MSESCDCLNECGDDERVGQYLVEPCEWRLAQAHREKARLTEELAMREDAASWRSHCANEEVASV